MIEPQKSPLRHTLIDELERLLSQYMLSRPHMSLSAVSRRSKVSEPTLRRIKKKQFRTLPTQTTILNFLTYISGKESIPQLIEKYPGPIAEYLKEEIPQQQEVSTEYNSELNEVLKDNTTYCIFKLCANSSGLTTQRVQRLFGEMGLQTLKLLVEKDYVQEVDGTYYSKVEWFMLPPEQINDKFQYLSQFIKSPSTTEDPFLRPLHVNYSSSLNAEGYKSIAKLQRKFLKKVREIIECESSQGAIPVMMLMALDTLDSKAPNEDFTVD